MSSSKKSNPMHVSFCNSKIPANQISMYNVLDYFCNTDNPFYDTTSNNQFIRMQNIFNRPEEESLRLMNGVQYVLWYSRAPIYIIMKLRREVSGEINPLAYYYVIDGNIHQAPDMYSLIQSRLLGSLEPLRNAFGEICNYIRFTTAQGYHWEFKNKKKNKNRVSKEEEKEKEEERLEQRSTEFQTKRTNTILRQLFHEMPADEALEPGSENLDCESDDPTDPTKPKEAVAPTESADPTKLIGAPKRAKPKFKKPFPKRADSRDCAHSSADVGEPAQASTSEEKSDEKTT